MDGCFFFFFVYLIWVKRCQCKDFDRNGYKMKSNSSNNIEDEREKRKYVSNMYNRKSNNAELSRFN